MPVGIKSIDCDRWYSVIFEADGDDEERKTIAELQRRLSRLELIF
jgi:hypothetical protein